MVEHGLVGGALMVVIGVVIWVVKKVIPAILLQNKTLVTGALKNMEANTSAIESNTKATEKVAQVLTTFIAVREERDKAFMKSLDAIEHKVDRL